MAASETALRMGGHHRPLTWLLSRRCTGRSSQVLQGGECSCDMSAPFQPSALGQPSLPAACRCKSRPNRASKPAMFRANYLSIRAPLPPSLQASPSSSRHQGVAPLVGSPGSILPSFPAWWKLQSHKWAEETISP